MNQQNEYSAVALNSALPEGKTAGRIIFTGFSIRFHSTEGNVELPLTGLIIKRGGTSGHLVLFEHPAYNGWVVYTEDKKILNGLKESGDEMVLKQIGEIRKKNIKISLIIFLSLTAIVAIIYGLFLLRNPVSKSIARSIPPQWEITLGENVFKGYMEGKRIIDDPVVKERLEKITNRLLSHIPDRRYEFHVTIIEDPVVNAMAVPGGFIALNTGLIVESENGEEVLGVLAHEVAHVTLQHGIRKMIDSLGLIVIVKAFLGNRSGLLGAILDNSSYLLNLKFSREFEQEADEKGFKYMDNANLNPSGLIEAFSGVLEKIKKSGDDKLDRLTNFISTHPDLQQRVDYLTERWNNVKDKKRFIDISADFNALKEALGDALKKNKREDELPEKE